MPKWEMPLAFFGGTFHAKAEPSRPMVKIPKLVHMRLAAHAQCARRTASRATVQRTGVASHGQMALFLLTGCRL